MFQHIVTVWQIDRGCSRMLEHAKPDLIQQPSSWLLHNIAVQSCYFIIPWQHVLSCIKPLIYQDGSNNVAKVCLFIKPWTVWTRRSTTLFKLAMFKLDQLNHVEACQQPCSNWPAQPHSSLSTGKNKLFVLTCDTWEKKNWNWKHRED